MAYMLGGGSGDGDDGATTTTAGRVEDDGLFRQCQAVSTVW